LLNPQITEIERHHAETRRPFGPRSAADISPDIRGHRRDPLGIASFAFLLIDGRFNLDLQKFYAIKIESGGVVAVKLF